MVHRSEYHKAEKQRGKIGKGLTGAISAKLVIKSATV